MHRDPRQRVELAERLVEHQDLRIVDQRARQRHPLRHAAGELVRIGIAERGQADQLDDRIDPVPLRLQDALRLQPERDIVPDRAPGKQRRILEHDDARRMRTGDAGIVFPQRPGARLLQPRDQPQQGRLAAAGRTEQRDELAGRDREADIVEHRQGRTVDIEGVANALDIEFGPDGGIGDRLGCGLHYHLTTPFCQTSRRSRVRNSSVIAPEQSSDITISAAYMLE